MIFYRAHNEVVTELHEFVRFMKNSGTLEVIWICEIYSGSLDLGLYFPDISFIILPSSHPSKLSILPPSPSWQSLLVAFLLNYSKFLKRKWNNICMYSFLIVLQPVSIPWVLHIYSVFLILLYIHGWTVVYNWFHIPSQDLEQSSFCNSFHFRIWRIFWSFNTSAIIPHH